MKILAVSNLFPPYCSGGNEIRLRQILEVLRARHEIHVLSSVLPPELSGEPEESWITRSMRQSVPYPRPLKRQRLNILRQSAYATYNHQLARRSILRHQPDVVLMSDTKRTFLGPAHAARVLQVPTLWDITDTSLSSYGRPHPLRPVLPFVSLKGLSFEHTSVISRYIRDTLAERGVLPKDSAFLNQGVNLSVFHDRGRAEDRKPRKLICVGTLIPQKGIHVVLEGFAELVLQDPSYQLTICGESGDTEYKARLKQIVAVRGIESNVTFRGRVPNDEVAGLYRQHDVYIFSSIWPEPFATTPLEGMASGAVVVGTSVGGQADFFEHRVNCMVYASEDPKDLAEQVRQLDSAELRTGLRQRARAQVLEDFDFRDYVTKYEQLLNQAAQGGSRSGL